MKLLVLCLLLAGVALAADHPDYSGVWTIDLSASDSVDDIMKAQGQSWIMRRAARSMSVTQTIEQHEDRLDLVVDSAVGKREQHARIGGDWEPHDTPEAGHVLAKTFWRGDALVTLTQLTLKDGTKAELEMSRTLEPGTLVQQLELRRPDQPPLRARRVFRKKA